VAFRGWTGHYADWIGIVVNLKAEKIRKGSIERKKGERKEPKRVEKARLERRMKNEGWEK